MSALASGDIGRCHDWHPVHRGSCSEPEVVGYDGDEVIAQREGRCKVDCVKCPEVRRPESSGREDRDAAGIDGLRAAGNRSGD